MSNPGLKHIAEQIFGYLNRHQNSSQMPIGIEAMVPISRKVMDNKRNMDNVVQLQN